jgi:signal recognition particle subunit SRP19
MKYPAHSFHVLIHIAEKQLMLQVAELVPKHHVRTRKQEVAKNSSAPALSKSGKGGRKKK